MYTQDMSVRLSPSLLSGPRQTDIRCTQGTACAGLWHIISPTRQVVVYQARPLTTCLRAEKGWGADVISIHALIFMRCAFELTNQIAMLISLHG